jgi:ParB family transcriptional regulator, chromosome partitioning protein
MSKPKGGLGKGLSALIRPAQQAERPSVSVPEKEIVLEEKGEITHIEVAKIRPNPYQPRADFDSEALDELKRSIQQKGIIQPVTVRRTKVGTYELISGERRIRASMEIGLKKIPAYIIEVKSDEEMLELALIENLQREHLNPVEIAISYQRLMQDVGLSPEDIAKKVSKDRTTVVNFLRLLKLPDKIQQSLRKNQLTVGHARALVSIPDESTQLRLFEKIIKKDLNVRQVEKLVKVVGKKSDKKQRPFSKSSEDAISSITEKIQQVLATKVKVNIQDGGRGEIIIEFYSQDDLGRLFDLLSTIEQ